MRQLANRVAVITGAASGIGRATAEQLAHRKCRLALLDIDEAGLHETARSLDVEVSCHPVDVASESAMAAAAEQVIAHHGAAHILINNAGVSVTKSFAHQPLDDFRWLFDINFWGTVYGCKLFLPHLQRADEGHIVNVCSLYGLAGVPSQSSYCASKFAVRGLSESLRSELAGSRVGVTCAYPGGIASNIVRNGRFDPRDVACREKAIARHDRLLPPSWAARAIVGAIEKNRARVLIAPQTRLLDAAVRLFPEAAVAAQGRLWRLLGI